MPSRVQTIAATSRRRHRILLGVRGSETFSTFTAADSTPNADETPMTLTFTLKDATDTAIAGASVTYA